MHVRDGMCQFPSICVWCSACIGVNDWFLLAESAGLATHYKTLQHTSLCSSFLPSPPAPFLLFPTVPCKAVAYADISPTKCMWTWTHDWQLTHVYGRKCKHTRTHTYGQWNHTKRDKTSCFDKHICWWWRWKWSVSVEGFQVVLQWDEWTEKWRVPTLLIHLLYKKKLFNILLKD